MFIYFRVNISFGIQLIHIGKNPSHCAVGNHTMCIGSYNKNGGGQLIMYSVSNLQTNLFGAKFPFFSIQIFSSHCFYYEYHLGFCGTLTVEKRIVERFKLKRKRMIISVPEFNLFKVLLVNKHILKKFTLCNIRK